MIFIIASINLFAWCLPDLCDWYTTVIFPIGYNVFGRITNIVKFSVGECMILLAILLGMGVIGFGIGCIFFRKKQNFMIWTVRFYKMVGVIVVNVLLVLTMNFFILYHCNPIDPNPNFEARKYTLEELELLRNYIVEQCNDYAEEMLRDQNCNVLYEGDLQKTAKEALWNLERDYPKLAGYYPNVKHIRFSDLMSQAYISGIYFPYSMEANCNANMYIANYPAVYCHELVHLHGYIYEDEAEFLSYLACINSEDPFFRYSGYLQVLGYVDNDYYDAVLQRDSEYGWEHYNAQPKCSEYVSQDNVFLPPETWEAIEEEALVDTEHIDEISTTVMDLNLKVNGVEEGVKAYSGVVKLLLQYYEGGLYE